MPSLSRIAGAIRPGVFSVLEQAVRQRRAQGDSILPLHIGDTYRAPPSASRYEAALVGGGDEQLYAYGATVGLAELRDALAARALGNGRGFEGMTGALHVQLGVGATHALSCASRVILEPGDEVVLAAPYWPLAHGILASTGASVVEVSLTGTLYDHPDLDAGEILARGVTDRTRAIYLITPNNPDGKVLTHKNLESIAKLAVERDLWVIADEVYADYAFDVEHLSIARFAGMADRTVSAYSFSKSHALAGARVGYVIASEKVVSAMRKIATHSVFNVPVLMQRSALAALVDDAWVAAAKRDYRTMRDAAYAALEGSGIRVSRPEGGVYLFLDFRDVLGGRSLATLLEQAVRRGVLLAPGEAFGASFQTSARLCYTACPPPSVLEGIALLRDAVTGG